MLLYVWETFAVLVVFKTCKKEFGIPISMKIHGFSQIRIYLLQKPIYFNFCVAFVFYILCGLFWCAYCMVSAKCGKLHFFGYHGNHSNKEADQNRQHRPRRKNFHALLSSWYVILTTVQFSSNSIKYLWSYREHNILLKQRFCDLSIFCEHHTQTQRHLR